jgi:hypothetical protein
MHISSGIRTHNRSVPADEGMYSGTSNFENNPIQEMIRLSSCSTFEFSFPIWNNVNWINPFQTPKIYPIWNIVSAYFKRPYW